MPTNIERLRGGIEEWLILNDLDTDTSFVSIDEWLERKEDELNDTELVLVFEGGLYDLMNYGGDAEVFLEFREYVESFGYFYELGNAWNMGFYPIEGYDFSPVTGKYSQKLKDERWRRKAELVKRKAGGKCQDCGSLFNLDVHHCYYTSMSSGNEPWEYPLTALRCLCRSCHERRSKEEIRMRAYLARFTTNQLISVREDLDHAFYWFEKDAVIELLSKLGHSDEDIRLAISDLLARRNDDT
jgi:hypothetical protein